MSDRVRRAIGVVETNSVPRGIKVIDDMVKMADVRVIESSPICPGKYLNIVSGPLSAVRSAVNKGKESAGTYLVDLVIIPDVHPDVLKAIMPATKASDIESVGIIETHAMATALEVADLVVKTADVTLLEVRLARCLGGKSFVSFTGNIASVRSGAEAGKDLARKRGQLLTSVVIPNPHKKLRSFVG